MAFDPSIISQIPDMAPNPVGAMERGFKLADLVNTEQLDRLRLNQVKTEQGEQLKMKEILKKEDLSTPQGISKAASALTKAGLAEQGMKLMGTAQQYQTGAIEQETRKLELASKQQDILAGALDNVYGELENFRTSNPKLATPEMLDMMAAKLAGPAMKNLKQQYPELGQYIDKFGQNPQNLTYAGIKSAEAASNRGQAMLKERLAERQTAVKEADEARKEREEKAKNADTGLSPGAQALKDDLAAKDPSFMASRSGAKSIQQQNKILEDWAKQGRTADDIIGSRQATKGTGAEVTKLYQQKAGLERTERSIVAKGGFLDQAEAAVKEVDLTKVKALGKLSNWTKDQMTDPALANYHTRVTELRQEYAIVLSKGGQMTVEAMKEAERVIPDYLTPASFARIREAIGAGVKTSMGAVDDSIKAATGKGEGKSSYTHASGAKVTIIE